MYKIAVFFFSVLTLSHLSAQNVIISGKSEDYAGKDIILYTYPDPVVHQKELLGSAKAGKDGSFAITITVNRTSEIYTDLEKYTGTLVVEPGKNYTITLPPYSPRTKDEARSPYFKPTLYWLGLPNDPGERPEFYSALIHNGIQY